MDQSHQNCIPQCYWKHCVWNFQVFQPSLANNVPDISTIRIHNFTIITNIKYPNPNLCKSWVNDISGSIFMKCNYYWYSHERHIMTTILNFFVATPSNKRGASTFKLLLYFQLKDPVLFQKCFTNFFLKHWSV